jgi:hypothetical protein
LSVPISVVSVAIASRSILKAQDTADAWPKLLRALHWRSD